MPARPRRGVHTGSTSSETSSTKSTTETLSDALYISDAEEVEETESDDGLSYMDEILGDIVLGKMRGMIEQARSIILTWSKIRTDRRAVERVEAARGSHERSMKNAEGLKAQFEATVTDEAPSGDEQLGGKLQKAQDATYRLADSLREAESAQ